MRVHLCVPRLSLFDADPTQAFFAFLPGVESTKAYDRTCGQGTVLYLPRPAALISAPEHTAAAVHIRHVIRRRARKRRGDSRRGSHCHTDRLNHAFKSVAAVTQTEPFCGKAKACRKRALFNFLLVIAPKRQPFRKQVDKI